MNGETSEAASPNYVSTSPRAAGRAGFLSFCLHCIILCVIHDTLYSDGDPEMGWTFNSLKSIPPDVNQSTGQ